MTPCNDSHENNSSEPSGRTLRHAFGNTDRTHEPKRNSLSKSAWNSLPFYLISRPQTGRWEAAATSLRLHALCYSKDAFSWCLTQLRKRTVAKDIPHLDQSLLEDPLDKRILLAVKRQMLAALLQVPFTARIVHSPPRTRERLPCSSWARGCRHCKNMVKPLMFEHVRMAF